MSFLVLLLALWVEKFSALRHQVQRDGFFLGELVRLERSGKVHPWWTLAILVLAPVALLMLLLHVLDPVAYGLLALPVHLLVLVYSLGRGDAKASLGPFRDAWRRGDDQAALHVAERDLGLAADNPHSLLVSVQGNLLWQVYQGFFAVIFWYFVLGPGAALAYRLLALCGEHSKQPALQARAEQLRHIMDWLPVRLLALSFALVGNFLAVTRVMLHELLNWHISAAHLVARVGRIADDIPEEEDSQRGLGRLDSLWELLLRCAVLWYAGFALWTVQEIELLPAKQLASIAATGLSQFANIHPHHLRQRPGNLRQMLRAVAHPWVHHRRHIWRIGLQHHTVQRQPRQGLAQPQRLRPGSCAAKPEPEAQLDVLASLFITTGERMNHPGLRRLVALERGDHLGMAAAHVQQGGQFEVASQLQLCFEQRLLARLVQVFEVVVQAELTHGAQPRVTVQALQPLAQLHQVLRAMLVEVDRVQAECGEQALVVTGKLPHPLEIRLIHPQYHHPLHPTRRRVGQQALAVGVEVGEVQVGVGVDEAHVQATLMRCLKVRPTACTPGS